MSKYDEGLQDLADFMGKQIDKLNEIKRPARTVGTPQLQDLFDLFADHAQDVYDQGQQERVLESAKEVLK